jgi:S-DNA-T family DNA segregation ATPase FtsK/SpoIIIE
MAIEVKEKTTLKTHSRSNEIAAIVLLALAVLIFLCLISFTLNDTSFISSGEKVSQKPQNWIGVVGANTAAILIGVFGWTAYILPALLAFIGWRLFREETLFPKTQRIIGYLLLIISITGLMELFGGDGALPPILRFPRLYPLLLSLL